jgi:hypothetical protein
LGAFGPQHQDRENPLNAGYWMNRHLCHTSAKWDLEVCSMTTKKPKTLVTFLGGPFDGHSESVAMPVEEFQTEMYLPVSQQVLGAEGSSGEPVGAVTSIAIYRLECEMQRPLYEIVRSVAPAKVGS